MKIIVNKYILSSRFFEQSDEIIFRSIMDLSKKVSSKYYPPRGKNILALTSRINSDKFMKSTLGGCCIEKVHQTILITREN